MIKSCDMYLSLLADGLHIIIIINSMKQKSMCQKQSINHISRQSYMYMIYRNVYMYSTYGINGCKHTCTQCTYIIKIVPVAVFLISTRRKIMGKNYKSWLEWGLNLELQGYQHKVLPLHHFSTVKTIEHFAQGIIGNC